MLVIHAHFEFQIPFHVLFVSLFIDLLDLPVDLLLLNGSLELLSVLFLKEFFPHIRFVLLALEILGLLSDDSTPLVDDATPINGIVPLLLLLELGHNLLLMLLGFFQRV